MNMPIDDDVTLIYTTATYSLDLDSTEVVNSRVGTATNGRSFRLVSIPNDNLNAQLAQYVTHMERAYSEHDWKIEIQFGNVIPIEESEVA